MFDDLNPEQRSAVLFGDGPLLIVAGAGTGKTSTLACRVGHLVERGVRPERILLLTFSRRAAREMLSRAHRSTGKLETERVWGGTFHAVANRLLRLHGRPLGLRPDFTVLDQSDGADVMNLLREELGFATRERRFPRKDTLASIYSRTVNAGEKLPDVLQRHYPWCVDEIDGIRQVFQAFTVRKRDQNVLDYDDLLLFWKALATAPQTREALASMFDHVLVDEYQDTNALQADILEGMRPPDTPRNLTVVGDDAQSIYGFRAATVKNILEFPVRFAGATVIRLEQNYRSIPPILAASNAAIELSPQRHEKTLWSARDGARRPILRTCLDEAEQCDFVCRSVLQHREEGVPLKHQAVLFRAAHHSDLLEVELARRNIPFVKYGGLKFLEAAHVKDALSLLRVLENPFDEVSWFRVLQLPEGVGPATARRLMDELGVRRVGRRSAVPVAAVPRGAGRRAEGGRHRRQGVARGARRLPRRRDRDAARCPARPHPYVPGAGLRSTVRRRRRPRPRPGAARVARERVRHARAVRLGADAGPPVVHRRSRRPAAPGRGLARALDDPFRQGAGVGRRPRDPRRRRHDPVRHGGRRRRRDRRGASAAVRRHDAGARHAGRVVPAALLPPPAWTGGSAQLRAAHAVPARTGPRAFRRGRPGGDPAPGRRAIDGTADVDAFLAGLWAD